MKQETAKFPYDQRMLNWDIEQHKDCLNFQRAKEWAIANGYSLKHDVSYNGFIEIVKEICTSDDPHDGNRLELQIFCNEHISDKDKFHSFDQYDMEIDFENDSIFKPMKYCYKMNHGEGGSKGSRNLEEILAFTLQREATLKAEFEQFLKDHPTTEWKLTDPDNYQYGRLVRGTPEFKEFDRSRFAELFEKMKTAPQEKVDEFFKSEFEGNVIWIQSKVILSMYDEKTKEDIAKTYYKNLAQLKEIYGKDWEFILAECIFEQEISGLY